MFRFLFYIFFVTTTSCSDRLMGQDAQDELKKLEQQFQRNDDLLQRIIRFSNNQILLTELEIVGEQSMKLRQFALEHIQSIKRLKSKSFQLQVRELSGNLTDLEKQRLQSEKKANMRQLIEASDASIKKLDSILLAHQIKRLKQISLQQKKIETNKFADEFGITLELQKELDLSSNEKSELEEKISEIRKDFYEKLRKLKKSATQKIIAELEEKQKESYKELIGEHYDFDAARRQAIIRANRK